MQATVNISVIRTIMLDLGGILFNIRSVEEWMKGFIHPLIGREIDKEVFQQIYLDNERGRISPEELRIRLERFAGHSIRMAELEAAWKGILLDMPERNMAIVRSLAEKYTLYLLSNANAIHVPAWWKIVHDRFGADAFPSAFSGFFYSHEIGSIKPEPMIYQEVHRRIGSPEKESILFFDDKLVNVEAAQSFGWQAVHIDVASTDLTTVVNELQLL